MVRKIRQWLLEPPIFPGDGEKTAQARTINSMGLYFVLALALAALIYVPFFVAHKAASWAAVLTLFVVYLISRCCMFRGQLTFSGLFLITSGWVMCEGLALIGGGITSPMMFALAAITIAVGLLFPPRVGNIFLAMSGLTGLGLAILQQNGIALPKFFVYPPLATWFFFVLSLVFINWTINLTARRLEKALAQAEQQNHALILAQATSRESEAKYRKLHESMRDGFAYVDMAGRVQEFNETFRAMLGYDSSELEKLSFVDFTPQKWHAFEQTVIEEQVLAQGYSQVYEKEYRRKDGTIFPVELRAFLIRGESGSSQGIWATVRDITERQDAANAIRQRNAELTALNQIGQALSKLNEPDQILELIVEQIGRVLDNRNLYIALYDTDNHYISFPVYIINGKRVPGAGRPQGNGITDTILRTNTPVLIQRDQEEFLRQRGIDLVGRPSRSFIGVPMQADKRVIGVLALQDYEQDNVYDDHHIDLLTTVAAQAAIALENARLYSAAQQELETRRRLEEELQARTRYIETIMENAPIGFAVRTLDSRSARFISSRFEAIYGVPHGALTTTDAFFNAIFPDPAARERIRACVMADNASGDAARMRWENVAIQTAAGDVRYISATNIPLPDQNLMISTVQDVTEQVRAEEALRASAARFRALTEDSLIGVYIIQDGLLSYTNAAMARIFGYKPEELLGASPFTLTHPEDRGLVVENIQRRMVGDTNSFQYEFRGICKNGRTIHVEAIGVRIDLDSRSSIIGNMLDITERKRAEEGLWFSEQTAHRTAEQLRMVNHIGVAIATGLDMERLLQTLFEQCQLIGDTDTFFVVLYDAAAEMLSFPFNYQDGERRFPAPCNIQESAGAARYIIDHRQTIYLPNLAVLPPGLTIIQPPGSPMQSYVGLPLILGERVVGFFSMESHALNAYKPDQIHTLELLATQVAIAIQNSQLFAQVQREMNLADALIDNLPGAFCLINAQGSIVRWNNYAETVMGYTQEEIQNLSVLDLIVEPDREQVDVTIARVFAEGQANVETQLLAKHGVKKIPVFVTISRIQFGDEVYLLSIGLDITDRKQREHELQAITTLSTALRTAPTRVEMLPVIVQQIISLLQCDSVTIEIIEAQSGDSIVEAGHGSWSALVGVRQTKGTGNNAIISETLQPFYVHDLEKDTGHTYPNWVNDGILDSAGVPLIAQEKLIGYIWVGAALEISTTQVRLLAAIADIAANAIHRATLHEQTQKNAADLALAYNTTLEGWAHALELRDQETEGHTRRVVEMTIALARLVGVGEENLEDIRRGALLHDIGKMGIPDSVLLKPGTLDEREWEIMRRHPEYAYNLLNQIEYLRPALGISYCHHEKWDGSGYPRGLKGEEIPFEARIFAIVDVWDALTSDRPYRKAWSNEDALRYIRQQSAKHFDPHVVEAFLGLLGKA